MKCPACKKTLKGKKYFPFCSEKCKMIDLYDWFYEENSVDLEVFKKNEILDKTWNDGNDGKV